MGGLFPDGTVPLFPGSVHVSGTFPATQTGWLSQRIELRQDFADHAAAEIGQPFKSTRMEISQRFLVEAHQVQQCRMYVADVDVLVGAA